jgi:DNA-binding transcriptional MerR regulator
LRLEASSHGGFSFVLIAFTVSQSATAIPEKLFFKIGEVCDIAGVQAHVLRYWETEFPMLAPQKNRAGQRTYRRRDVEMALRIKELLYDEQYTIAGAKKKLAGEIRGPNRDGGQSTSAKTPARSLQRPPSLAARFSAPPSSASSSATSSAPVATTTDDQRAHLIQIAKQLREILDLLDEGEADIASTPAKRKR